MIDISKYGIEPNTQKDMTGNFLNLLEDLRGVEGDKLIKLPKGEYHLYPQKAKRRIYYITNTVSQSEMAIPERIIALHIKNTKDLTLDGSGSTLIIHGKMTAAIIDLSKNITLKNLVIDTDRPTISLVEVEKKNLFSSVIKIHKDSKYKVENGRLYFYGENFNDDAKKVYGNSWANVFFYKDNPDVIRRTSKNPMRKSYKCEDLGDNRVKYKYFGYNGIKEGENYHLHENKRDQCGIAIIKSENITLENVEIRQNVSFAIVAQDSKDITVDRARLAPDEKSERYASSQADFMHICMCRGKFTLKNSYFSGAFDDCLNVHGVHFKITKVMDNLVTVKFKHPQAYGYNPFDEGDEIELIDRATLAPKNIKAKVLSTIMVSSYEIELTLDKKLEGATCLDCIENLTKIPEVEVDNNYFSRVPTRGVLMTSGKKTVISNNIFYKTQMSGLLVSDDAWSWYESGRVNDMLIKGNKFVECQGQAILIKPENSIFKNIVHKNIVIEDNEFILNNTLAVNAKNSQLTLRNNKYEGGGAVVNKINNCELTLEESEEIVNKTQKK